MIYNLHNLNYNCAVQTLILFRNITSRYTYIYNNYCVCVFKLLNVQGTQCILIIQHNNYCIANIRSTFGYPWYVYQLSQSTSIVYIPRFLVFLPANPSHFSHCKCFSIRIPFLSISTTLSIQPTGCTNEHFDHE